MRLQIPLTPGPLNQVSVLCLIDSCTVLRLESIAFSTLMNEAESSETAAQEGNTSPNSQQDRARSGSPEFEKPAIQVDPCHSDEYTAVFIPWPFEAPLKGLTAVPESIVPIIDSLPTIQERIRAPLIWNRSLPVSANVAMIEFNRVEEKLFRKRVGGAWWRNIEWFARELNMAARVIKGEDLGKVLGEWKEPEIEKVGTSEETRTDDETGGKAQESDIRTPAPPAEAAEAETQAHEETGVKAHESDIRTQGPLAEAAEAEAQAHKETGVKAQEAETRTLDLLAEAATLHGQSGEVSATTAAKSATGKGKEDEPYSIDEDTEAAFRLLSLSSAPLVTPHLDPYILASSNPLSALWLLTNRWFSAGPAAASYFWVALEAAVRIKSTVVHSLNIPAPPSLWAGAVDWTEPRVGMTLLLTLASSKSNMFDSFAKYSKSLGPRDMKVEKMREKKSASLTKAIKVAKADARDKGRTTVLGVRLRDVLYAQMCEVHGREIHRFFTSFDRMVVLGVCKEGAKMWLVGGEGGQWRSLKASNDGFGAELGCWDELDEFVRDFEGVAVANVGCGT